MKKQAVPFKKLRLSRETLRALQEADLQKAAAGLTEGWCASTETGRPCIAAGFAGLVAPGCLAR